MSTSKGNHSRTRSQRYQNKTAFKNDLHDTSPKIKIINSLDIAGVCKRCKDVIDWKIKYKKYKPLTAPKKCVKCEQKAVKHAYHVMCKSCANTEHVCPKCCKHIEVINKEIASVTEQNELQSILDTLPERKRRTLLRFMNKEESGKINFDSVANEEFKLKLEKLQISTNKILGDTNDSDSEFSESDNSEK